MSKVIVFGSLNMDLSVESPHMPKLGETVIGGGFVTNPGGKGANQAVAAAKLGAQVQMIGAVGADAFGDQMLAALADAGVSCERVSRAQNAPTGVALITRVGGDNFITVDSGANMVAGIDDVKAALDDIAQPGDVFLCQLECDFETTMQALKYAHEQGLYTVVNPAPARELPGWVLPYLDFVVVNEGECETITGIYPDDEVTCRAAMDKLAAAGVGLVAVTLGARGSMVLADGEFLVSTPPAVKAVDTTCAGDTYIGAFLAAHARGECVAAALDLATKASAMATTKVGAQQSIPLLAEVRGE